MGVFGQQQVNMLSGLFLLVILATSATADQTIKWTITGEAFEACIIPGEKLTFEWNGGHNVERVAKEGYEECSGFKSDEPTEGPFEFQTSTGYLLLRVWGWRTLQVWQPEGDRDCVQQLLDVDLYNFI